MKKVEKVLFGMVVLLTMGVTLSIGQDINENPFIGKWEVKTLETPEGDVEIEVEFFVVEGKLAGTIAKKDEGKTELTSVKPDGDRVDFSFYSVSRGYELSYYLKIVEEGVSTGYLLDMFKLEGKMVKAEE